MWILSECVFASVQNIAHTDTVESYDRVTDLSSEVINGWYYTKQEMVSGYFDSVFDFNLTYYLI